MAQREKPSVEHVPPIRFKGVGADLPSTDPENLHEAERGTRKLAAMAPNTLRILGTESRNILSRVPQNELTRLHQEIQRDAETAAEVIERRKARRPPRRQ